MKWIKVILKAFKKKCPECKKRNNDVKCYATDGVGKYTSTGRQCNDCGNFWYS